MNRHESVYRRANDESGLVDKRYQMCYTAECCTVFHASNLCLRPSGKEIAERKDIKLYTADEIKEAKSNGIHIDNDSHYAKDAMEWHDDLLKESSENGQMSLDNDYIYIEGTAQELLDDAMFEAKEHGTWHTKAAKAIIAAVTGEGAATPSQLRRLYEELVRARNNHVAMEIDPERLVPRDNEFEQNLKAMFKEWTEDASPELNAAGRELMESNFPEENEEECVKI